MVDIKDLPEDEYGIPLYSPNNNARRIVLDATKRFKRNPSESMANYLEEEYGLTFDYSDADAGEEPQHTDYSHIIGDPDNLEPF